MMLKQTFSLIETVILLIVFLAFAVYCAYFPPRLNRGRS